MAVYKHRSEITSSHKKYYIANFETIEEKFYLTTQVPDGRKNMRLSTTALRDDFKTRLEHWEGVVASLTENPLLLTEIQDWSVRLEVFIQQKIKWLELDFKNFDLQDEYLRSVSEGFDDLERIMRTEKTLLDDIEGQDLKNILQKIKNYYTRYLVPLLNIFSKLENDYIAITTNAILQNSKKVLILETNIHALQKERDSIANRFLKFIHATDHNDIHKMIKNLELHRKILRLTMQHDRLNLYYFNHERPPELKEMKEKADALRAELRKITGVSYDK